MFQKFKYDAWMKMQLFTNNILGLWHPPDERIIGDDIGDDFPLPEGSVPGITAPPEP